MASIETTTRRSPQRGPQFLFGSLQAWISSHHADIAAATILLIATFVVFVPAMHVMITERRGDHIAHIRVAEQLAATGQILSPHFLYPLFITLVVAVLPHVSFATAAIVISSLLYLITALTLYAILRRAWPSRNGTAEALMTAALAFAMMFIWPIAALVPLDGRLYQGYVATGNVYHNPTIVPLKPIAILLFACVVAACARPLAGLEKYLVTAAMALLTVLSALAKPSYLICLLPAVFLFGAWAYHRRRPFDWQALLCGLFLPGAAILAVQYMFTYIGEKAIQDQTSGFAIAPLAVFSIYSELLLPKFLLSIVFPACVYLLYFRSAQRNLGLNLAWLVFALGVFYTYFLVEVGTRQSHGNLAWSGQISSFVLFVVSVTFLIRQMAPRLKVAWPISGWDRPTTICLAAFGLHLAFGIAWFFRNVGPSYSIW
jgi:hypothetical protein